MYLNVLEKYLKIEVLLQCTSTQDFSEMYLSTFQVLYKLYLSTDVFKYKVLLSSSVKQCCHLIGGRHTKILDGPTCDYMLITVIFLHYCHGQPIQRSASFIL